MTPRLFETIGFDGAVWRFAADHRARMAASAADLGRRFAAAAFDAALSEVTPTDGTPRLARLVLMESGVMRVETRPLDPLPEPVRLILTRVVVDPADLWLRHKTTRRDAYDAAMAEARALGADDGILVNTAGRVTETSRMTLFADTGNGPLVTPPLSEGLLPGVLRAHLLVTGDAVEGRLAPDDLRATRRLFVGNAARGLLQAVMVERADRAAPGMRGPLGPPVHPGSPVHPGP